MLRLKFRVFALGQVRTRLSTHGSGTVYAICVGVNDCSTDNSGYSDQCSEGQQSLHTGQSAPQPEESL